MPFTIIRSDITKVSADAIVNTANPIAGYGSGTDTAIYKAAGEERLLEARAGIGPIEPGHAAYTPAFDLDAKYIIHTVGPVWKGGNDHELETLASCYRESLLLANNLSCSSIAFPLISSGNYGFPKDQALHVALNEISDFLKLSEIEVTLVVFDRQSFEISSRLTESIQQYIDENYVAEHSAVEYNAGRSVVQRNKVFNLDDTADLSVPLGRIESDDAELTEEEFDAYFDSLYRESRMQAPQSESSYAPAAGLDDVIKSLGQTFQEKLLSLIDERGFTDTQVYKRANVDRKLFSKIRCNPEYKPSKATALALSIALELNLDETKDLLGRAGLALSPSSKSDLIVQYCIEHHIYNIYDINVLLFDYDQQLLGA